MRTVLVFPPKASPTYIPLGVASLVPFVRATVPDVCVEVLDLNVDMWIDIADTIPGGTDLVEFVKGRRGNFYDLDSILARRDTWAMLRTRMREYEGGAKRYVTTGETDAELTRWLAVSMSRILASDPELIGFSILFLEQVPFAVALADAIRAASGFGAQPSVPGRPRIVFGGAAMSALYVEDLLRACSSVDDVVCGEGEAALAALCRNEDRQSVPGLVYRSAHGIERNPRPHPLNLTSLPAPDFTCLSLDRYFNPVPVLPVQFSRGCAWRRCRFCAHNFGFSAYRRKSHSLFVDQLQACQTQLGVRHFYSVDEYVQPVDMDAITGELVERRLDFAFHVLGKPSSQYTPDRLERWSEAGCRWIGWGVESGSQRLLDLINKGTNAADIEQTIRAAADAGISNLAMMIFGLPTSTDDDLVQSLAFIDRIYPSIDAMAVSSFVLFDGTQFARTPVRYGLAIQGAQEIFHANGTTVCSRRLRYQEIADDGSLRPPRSALEVGAWLKHRRWLGDPPLLEQMPCEHYLLHAAHSWETGCTPRSPRARSA